MEGCMGGGDKGHLAMQVLDEIRDLIQSRIGGGLAPEKVEVKAEMTDPEAGEMGEAPPDDLGLSDEDAAALDGLYSSELGGEGGGEEEEGDDELKKKLMGA